MCRDRRWITDCLGLEVPVENDLQTGRRNFPGDANILKLDYSDCITVYIY